MRFIKESIPSLITGMVEKYKTNQEREKAMQQKRKNQAMMRYAFENYYETIAEILMIAIKNTTHVTSLTPHHLSQLFYPQECVGMSKWGFVVFSYRGWNIPGSALSTKRIERILQKEINVVRYRYNFPELALQISLKADREVVFRITRKAWVDDYEKNLRNSGTEKH